MELKVEIKEFAEEDVSILLDSTVFGREGAMRYRHTSIKERLKEINEPFFVNLRRSDKLLGTINLSKRFFETGITSLPSYYIRYFSFMNQWRTQKHSSKKAKSNSPIKKTINQVFVNCQNFDPTSSEALYYAYMELDNERSNRIAREFGFTAIRKFSTSVFSRFFPKHNPEVKKAQTDQVDEIKSSLHEFYNNYGFYESNYLLKRGNYWVLERDGKVIAGLQATPIKWEIMELPGKSGRLLYQLLPLTPFIRKLFNPKNYWFLAFEYAFYPKGQAKLLENLMETACADEKINSGIIWSDMESSLQTDLRKQIKLGLMNKLQSDIPASIIARYEGDNPNIIQELKSKPAYISAFDIT